MSYLFKAISILLVLILQVQGDSVSPLGIMGLLLLVAIWIVREKYFPNPLLLAAEYVLVIALTIADPVFLLLTAVLAFDRAQGVSGPFCHCLQPCCFTGERNFSSSWAFAPRHQRHT